MKKVTNSHLGHRDRMKEMFINNVNNNNNYSDKYLLELLLFYGIPRKDVKQLTNELLNEFGSIANLLTTDLDSLLLVNKLSKNTIVLLKLINKIFEHMLLSKIQQKGDALNNLSDLLQFAKLKIAHKSYECLYMVFLNAKRCYLSSYIIDTGDVNNLTFYPKDILLKSISKPAKYVVMFHNHPSGEVKPSANDLATTNDIIDLLASINITLIDHFIISPTQCFSILNKTNLSYPQNNLINISQKDYLYKM